MNNNLAKDIITEYVFSDYNITSIYKFVSDNVSDVEKKLYAESLLTSALQKAIIALNQKI